MQKLKIYPVQHFSEKQKTVVHGPPIESAQFSSVSVI